MSGRCIYPDSAHRWQVLPALLVVQAGDFIRETTAGGSEFGLVITSGAKAFDVIWLGGSTVRYRHGVRDIRIVGATEVDTLTRKHLLGEAEVARRERKAKAGVRRGSVSPSRRPIP